MNFQQQEIPEVWLHRVTMQEQVQDQQQPFSPWVGYENDCDHPFQTETAGHNHHQELQAKEKLVYALFLRQQ